MEINISIGWEEIKFFLALVVAGLGYGYHCYRTGIRKGFDDAMYTLEYEGIVKIDDETLEVSRVSDNEFRKFQESLEYSE